MKGIMIPDHVFLLTCWYEENSAPNSTVWRFRLEETSKGEDYRFANMEVMFEFLQNRLLESASNEKDDRIDTV